MDKRYQVFVSSTYMDLREERSAVIRVLMEMNCIPAGMELFPAADEEQFKFIQRVIDDCDYYVVIIGNRYGSVAAEGISYTEKEYDYALQKGLRVLAFLHDNPSEIPFGKSDIDPKLRERLLAFREKVKAGRLVKTWKTADQLRTEVVLSLTATIAEYPAVGWVRANHLANMDALEQLNELRQRNQELEKLVHMEAPALADLAPLDAKIELPVTYRNRDGDHSVTLKLTWAETFALIAPHLLEHPANATVHSVLSTTLLKKSGRWGYSASLDDQVFQSVKIQFIALRLVTVEYTRTVSGSAGLFWNLTPKGREALMQLRTTKAPPS